MDADGREGLVLKQLVQGLASADRLDEDDHLQVKFEGEKEYQENECKQWSRQHHKLIKTTPTRYVRPCALHHHLHTDTTKPITNNNNNNNT